MVPYTATCLAEWTDYNGHMNDAFYGRVFSDAVDEMMLVVGLGPDYRAATQGTTKGTVYTLEDHRWYEREVHEGATLEVETHVLDVDAKRIHLWQSLNVQGQRCAVAETMLLHISQAGPTPRSAPMPDQAQAALREHLLTQAVSPRAGTMGIRRP